MGNGQYRYLSNSEAISLIGSRKWVEIHDRLERPGNKYVDFEFFGHVLRSRFERIVSFKCKCSCGFSLFALSSLS